MRERTAWRLGLFLGFFLRGYRRCLRWQVQGAENLQLPCLLAVWHGRLLGVLLHQAGSGMVTMASLSPDGALAAGAVRALGCKAVRGSATRGGSKAIRDLKRALEEGAPLAGLTVDGPKGPWRKVKPGVVAMARWLGIPIVPASFSGNKVRLLKSWDRMLVPKPASRVLVGYGSPLAPHLLPEDLEEACQLVGEAVDRLTHDLDSVAFGRGLWPEVPQ